jgi:cell division protein ZipA
MDIKDWILIGGSVLLAAVVMHGLWLAWRNRRDTLRLEIDPNIPKEPMDELELLRGELPNGGARVIAKAPVEQGALDLDGATPIVAERNVPTRARREPTADRPKVVVSKNQPAAPRRPAQRRPEPPEEGPSELLIINVIARDGKTFDGEPLLAVLLRNALKFGDMNIFHRVEPASKVVLFSLASATEPGTFDLSAMDKFSTRGVSLFMRLPGPEQPIATFDDMLGVARDIASSLDGELKDEHKNVMTPQTVEHCRQRIAEFSRKRLSLRAESGLR